MSKASDLAGFVPSISPTDNLTVGVVTATGYVRTGAAAGEVLTADGSSKAIESPTAMSIIFGL